MEKLALGKSYCATTILGAIVNCSDNNVKLTIADYKNSFKQFHGLPNFYGYTNAINGIKEFYKEMEYRIEHSDEKNENYPISYLFIDEVSSLIQAQKTKKEKDDLLNMISNILNLGREYNCRIIIGMQRADASFFEGGARDNFHNIIALGRLSKEQKNMLFSDYKDKMTINSFKQGEGYILVEGHDIERVKVEKIKDIRKLHDSIKEALKR